MQTRHVLSCGCLVRDTRATTHRQSRTVTYRRWITMKSRVRETNDRSDRYYARGIRVCDRWHASFEAFLVDMGPCPAGFTLERIDNDRGYEPGNCKWIPRCEQARNTANSVRLTLNGETRLAIDWSRCLGIPSYVISRRVKAGWPVEQVLNPDLSPGEAVRLGRRLRGLPVKR
jgi:hypothetical protein